MNPEIRQPTSSRSVESFGHASRTAASVVAHRTWKGIGTLTYILLKVKRQRTLSAIVRTNELACDGIVTVVSNSKRSG